MNIPISSPRLDINDMRRRLGDDDALIADLIGLFVEDYPAQLAAIEAAVTTRQLDALRREAHGLKGAASNLSAGGVIEAAAALERMAERGDASQLDQQFRQLTLEVELLVHDVRQAPSAKL